MHSHYQPMSLCNSYLFTNTNFNTSPEDFNVNNIAYIPEQFAESLKLWRSHILDYDPISFMYKSYPEMAAQNNIFSSDTLYTSPQKSPELECYQPSANNSQSSPSNQTTFSNGVDCSSCSAMASGCISEALTEDHVNMHTTQSIPIIPCNSIPSPDSCSIPLFTTTIKGTKNSSSSNKSRLKTPKNSADSKKDKLLKNREAAAKCRKKRKEYLKAKKDLIEFTCKENIRLERQILCLRENIADLKLLLASACRV